MHGASSQLFHLKKKNTVEVDEYLRPRFYWYLNHEHRYRMELDTQRYNSLVCYIKNDSLIIESNKQLLRDLLDNICGIKKVDLFG